MAAVDAQRTETPSAARDEYFGTTVLPRSFQQWLADISSALETGQRRWLSGHHNLHSLYMLQRNPDVRRFYQRCNDCYIDGTPVRMILKGFGVPTTAELRFTLMDHFLDLLQHAEKQNWSIFYLGSTEAATNVGSMLIAEKFPKLRIRLQHGFSTDTLSLIQTINAWQPDILLVGMGMPLQERWIVENLDDLDAGFVAQAGATLDYYTGAQAKPPLWMSHHGMAWLYRLLKDPLRLWRRYLLEPWTLIRPTFRQWYRHRKFP